MDQTEDQTPLLYADLETLCTDVQRRCQDYMGMYGPTVTCFVLVGVPLYAFLARAAGLTGGDEPVQRTVVHGPELALTLMGHTVVPWLDLPDMGALTHWSHTAEMRVVSLESGDQGWQHYRSLAVRADETSAPRMIEPCRAQRGAILCPCGGAVLHWEED